MNTPVQTVVPGDDEPDLQTVVRSLTTQRLQTLVVVPQTVESGSANDCGPGPQWEQQRLQWMYELMYTVMPNSPLRHDPTSPVKYNANEGLLVPNEPESLQWYFQKDLEKMAQGAASSKDEAAFTRAVLSSRLATLMDNKGWSLYSGVRTKGQFMEMVPRLFNMEQRNYYNHVNYGKNLNDFCLHNCPDIQTLRGGPPVLMVNEMYNPEVLKSLFSRLKDVKVEDARRWPRDEFRKALLDPSLAAYFDWLDERREKDREGRLLRSPAKKKPKAKRKTKSYGAGYYGAMTLEALLRSIADKPRLIRDYASILQFQQKPVFFVVRDDYHVTWTRSQLMGHDRIFSEQFYGRFLRKVVYQTDDFLAEIPENADMGYVAAGFKKQGRKSNEEKIKVALAIARSADQDVEDQVYSRWGNHRNFVAETFGMTGGTYDLYLRTGRVLKYKAVAIMDHLDTRVKGIFGNLQYIPRGLATLAGHEDLFWMALHRLSTSDFSALVHSKNEVVYLQKMLGRFRCFIDMAEDNLKDKKLTGDFPMERLGVVGAAEPWEENKIRDFSLAYEPSKHSTEKPVTKEVPPEAKR